MLVGHDFKIPHWNSLCTSKNSRFSARNTFLITNFIFDDVTN